MTALVYKYGLRGHDELPAELWEQMLLAHRFRNALVELTHGYEQQLRNLWSGHPKVAEIERALELYF